MAPLKAAKQRAKAEKQAIRRSLVIEGAPLRRSSRAAAAATSAKLSEKPDADSDSQEGSDEKASASDSAEDSPSRQHDSYDTLGINCPFT